MKPATVPGTLQFMAIEVLEGKGHTYHTISSYPLRLHISIHIHDDGVDNLKANKWISEQQVAFENGILALYTNCSKQG